MPMATGIGWIEAEAGPCLRQLRLDCSSAAPSIVFGDEGLAAALA
jgi:hypothetical protein